MTKSIYPKIALVGRPNVGKSTLFNRLVGKQKALVNSTPGLTRDRQEAEALVDGLPFLVVDTAGFEHRDEATMQAKMWDQAEKAVQQAEAVIFIIDGIAGITAQDEVIAQYLREKNKPIICVVNKTDAKKAEPTIMEAYALGFGRPISLAATHGHGMEELYEHIAPYVSAAAARMKKRGSLEIKSLKEKKKDLDVALENADIEEPEHGENQTYKALQFAVIGRPNVGKSSLLNAIIKEERLLVGSEAGMTRDSIFLNWTYKDMPFELIDTAGLRKSARITGIVERLSTQQTHEAIQFAPIVVILLDITRALEKQDLVIVHDVYKEGRCVIIGLNKWDLIEPSQREEYTKKFKEQLDIVLPQAEGIPFVPLSAKTGFGLNNLFDVCLKLYTVWQKKISTGKLNTWLEMALSAHQPPLVRGRRLKIRYIMQKKARPPTFFLFVNIKDGFPESYIRYMQRKLRIAFDFPGVPIRFILKKGENPYHTKTPKHP